MSLRPLLPLVLLLSLAAAGGAVAQSVQAHRPSRNGRPIRLRGRRRGVFCDGQAPERRSAPDGYTQAILPHAPAGRKSQHELNLVAGFAFAPDRRRPSARRQEL